MLDKFVGIAYIAVVVSQLIGMIIVRHKGKGHLDTSASTLGLFWY
jgi:hypothetical protein